MRVDALLGSRVRRRFEGFSRSLTPGPAPFAHLPTTDYRFRHFQLSIHSAGPGAFRASAGYYFSKFTTGVNTERTRGHFNLDPDSTSNSVHPFGS
jgi:hypothetical protein